ERKLSCKDQLLIFDKNFYSIRDQASDGQCAQVTDPIFLCSLSVVFPRIDVVFYQFDQIFERKILRYESEVDPILKINNRITNIIGSFNKIRQRMPFKSGIISGFIRN